MPQEHIPKDATINDVVEKMRRPDEYVRQLLGHMHKLKSESPNLVVRIGVTGRGVAPHYRIDRRSVGTAIFGDGPMIEFTPLAAFHGSSHEPLVPEGEEPDILREEHWSTAHMTFEEVQALLGRLRAARR